MKVEQYSWTAGAGWVPALLEVRNGSSQLVFVFGGREELERGGLIEELSASFPNACLVGCSTAGEILGSSVSDNSVSVSAVTFETSKISIESVELEGVGGSFGAGKRLASELLSPELKHILVITAGLNLNGSDLVEGISSVLPESVSVSGGMAGDGTNFERTLVLDRKRIARNLIVGIGFYGDDIKVSSSSYGGWSKFGPERLVTESEGSVLLELDHKPALDLYKQYLGDLADELPASGLLFPLAILSDGQTIVRTILGVDEEQGSITFAGDIPKGSKVHLVRAKNEELIEGAKVAAEQLEFTNSDSGLAFLVSCVGRKLVLKQRTEEEVEVVRSILGEGVETFGFYSYGELSSWEKEGRCRVHNQTMTITLIEENSK